MDADGEILALGLMLALTLDEGEVLAEGDVDAETLLDGLVDAEGDTLALGLMLALTDELGEREALGEVDADTLDDGDMEAEGLRDADGDTDADGLLPLDLISMPIIPNSPATLDVKSTVVSLSARNSLVPCRPLVDASSSEVFVNPLPAVMVSPLLPTAIAP